MDENILEEIIASSQFQVDAFDGLIKIEGRILSPSEVESAGLASALLASAVFKGQNQKSIKAKQDLIEKYQNGEVDDLDEIMKLVGSINPTQLKEMSERQDLLLIKCVRRCSKDGGKNWEPLHLVSAIDQQNAAQNKLWVGMLNSDDRALILSKAMTGHEEAALRLKSFRK